MDASDDAAIAAKRAEIAARVAAARDAELAQLEVKVELLAQHLEQRRAVPALVRLHRRVELRGRDVALGHVLVGRRETVVSSSSNHI